MPEPIVETSLGRIQGSVTEGIEVFKGIPYGASTAGEGRFKAPRAAEPWSGLRDGTVYGPTCPQEGSVADPSSLADGSIIGPLPELPQQSERLPRFALTS